MSTSLGVIGDSTDSSVPKIVTLVFNQDQLGAGHSGFSLLTLIAARLQFYGSVMTDERSGSISVDLKVHSQEFYDYVKTALPGICNDLTGKTPLASYL